jgi:2-oxoglutarate ferredoxin oxidoreductase subunit alpha
MKTLMKGNEAIAEAAIRAGCDAYFGYPITPQTEVLEYMSRRMPELGRAFVQAESELGAINMVYGAACTGARVMTTTSGPGYSLMQEGISYIAMSFVPCVLVNIMRGGPGLGNIQPAQGDYFQMTKGGGHGDYHLLALAPSTVQETVDLVIEAFDLADKYCQPVTVIADGMIVRNVRGR